MSLDHEPFMRMAIEEAEAAGAEGNAAVGSVIVKSGEVIARGRNLVTTDLDPTAHAETVALRNAGRHGTLESGGLILPDCTLYTTFEPCPMCTGAIMAAGIDVVVVGSTHDPQRHPYGGLTPQRVIEMAGRSDRLVVIGDVLSAECDEVRDRWRNHNFGD